MLLRKVGKERVATLKRVANPEELARFDISAYPQTPAAFKEEDWKTNNLFSSEQRIRDLIQNVGTRGNTLVDRLFKVSISYSVVYWRG